LCWYIGLDKFAPNVSELLGLEDSGSGGLDADRVQALERQVVALKRLAKDLLAAQEESVRFSAISRGVLHLGLFGSAIYYFNRRQDKFARLSRRYASAALFLQQYMSPYVRIKLVSDDFLASLGDSLDSSLSTISTEASPHKFNPTSPGGAPSSPQKTRDARASLYTSPGGGAANRGVAELAILVDTRCQQIETKTDALRRDMMTEIRKVREAAGLQAPRVE